MLPFDGKTPYRLPAFATGYETPAQRNKRLRTYQRQLETQQKRQEDRDSRELFRTISRNAPNVKLRPKPVPIPDAPDPESHIFGPTIPKPLLAEPTGLPRGSQTRFDYYLDNALDDYTSTFGYSPSVESETYKSLERKARREWREEQSNVPDDEVKLRELIGDAALNFSDPNRLAEYLQSQGVRLPPGDYRDKSKIADIISFQEDKPPDIFGRSREQRAAKPLGPELPERDSKWQTIADNVNPVTLDYVQRQVRADNPDLEPGQVREQAYLTLRAGQHLSNVLDEWKWPEEGRDSPPPSAIDEALRRTQEESEDLMGDPEEFSPSLIGKALGGTLKIIDKAVNADIFPTLDPTRGFRPAFVSLAEVEAEGRYRAKPVARAALAGAAVPFRGGEQAFGAVTGVQTTTVSDAVRSGIATDILTEIINPANVALALPFIGAGTKGLTGGRLAAQITANLLGTGLEPGLVRGTLRGLSIVARNPGRITEISTRIRNLPVFQEGLTRLNETRAFVKGVEATDHIALQRVVDDLASQRSSAAGDLALRVSVEEDLRKGRAIEDIAATGATVPDRSTLFRQAREVEIKAQDLTRERFGFGTSLDTAAKADEEIQELVNQATSLREQMRVPRVLTGEEGGGFLPFTAPETNDTIINKVLSRVDAGENPGYSLKKLRDITQDLVRKRSPIGRAEDISALRLSTAEITDILKVYKEGGTDFLQIISDAKAARQGPLRAAAVPELIGQTEDMTAAVNLAFRTEKALIGGRQFGAFRNLPDFADRLAMKDEYIRIARTQIEEVDNSVLRSTMEDDIDFVDWTWRVYSGELDEVTAREDVIRMLSRLTKEHRGTVDDRLRKLAVEEAQTLDREASEIVKSSGLKGSKAKSAKNRLLQGALDHRAGEVRFDAGRRLKILFDSTSDQRTRDRAYDGLKTLTEKGRTPNAEHLDALEQILGTDGLKALLSSRHLGEKATIHLMDTLGIPRALMSSFDLSALLRQGGILGASHPLIWLKAAGQSIGGFFSEKYALEVNEALRYGRGTIKFGDETRDLYEIATDVSELAMTRYGKEVSVTEFEEAIASSFIGKIPGFRQSQRAYTLFLNLLRANVHDSVVRGWAREATRVGGRQFSGEDLKDIGFFLNNATGRGKIPEGAGWQNFAGILNVGFFSPRLQLSRFQLIGDVARAIPRAGRGVGSRSANQILRDMGLFFAEGFAILGLVEVASRAGAPVSVGLIPFDINSDGSISSNPNFGKIRLGNTRIDFWGGFSQYARYFSEISARSATGDWEGASKRLLDLVRSKTSPIAGGAWDAVTGHDIVGNPVSYKISDIDSAFENLFLSRTIPLGIQDIIQAGYASSWKPAEVILAGAGSFFGTGVSSYRDLREERSTRRNEISQELYGLDYDSKDLSSLDRKAINEDPEVVSLDEEMQQAGIARGDKFSVYEEDLDKFDELLESRGVIINAQGEEEKIVNWTQTQLDDMLKLGTIDGPQWAEHRRVNEQKMWAARLTFVAENSPFTEEREVTNPVDEAMTEYFDISPAQFALPNGDMDWDGYEEARDKARKKALDADTTGNVSDYFEAHEETETEKAYRQAREVKYGKFGARAAGLDNLPIYDGGVTQGQVDGMLKVAKDALANYGNPMGLSRYLQWLYYNGGPDWQTNTVSISYWVSRGLREYVINDEYENKLMNNPDVVRFFPSEFDNLNPENQQAFLDINGLNYVSKARQEEILSGATGLTPPGQTPDERLQAAYGGQ